MTIWALVFDAYGTLYDVQSVLAKAERRVRAEAR
jgi:FMN phosphatase YigB (HAD superfamily)